MQTSNKLSVGVLVERSYQRGVKHVVCSPGSRNAPIVIACDLHPGIQTHVIHDERAAGFYALGLALALKEPVALTCTSGSALLNYYPAVAEAYYQSVPLLIWSADRPVEWVNHGDGQTIVQKNVYANHIMYETELHETEEELSLVSKIDLGFDKIRNWPGPIHVNIPLNEPLYEIIEREIRLPKIVEAGEQLNAIEWNFLATEWNNAKRKMILCGQLKNDSELTRLLAELAADNSVLVMVENLSNVQDSKFIHSIDRVLNVLPDNSESYEPDLLLTIGTSVVSKRIKGFLRSINNLRHWKIGFEFPEMDTYRGDRVSFELKPEVFLKELINHREGSNLSNYGGKWRTFDFLAKDAQLEILDTMPYSDLKVFESIVQYLPESSVLHAGNSSVVRYLQLFDPIKDVVYQCNRGTSGIDGSLSTAVGYAKASPGILNVLVIGDVSFFYDSNGFWNNELPDNLKVVLINNGGGGIFRYIEGASSSKQLERYFEAKHNISAEGICRTYGVKYFKAIDMQSVDTGLEKLLYEEGLGISLLEVHTPYSVNDEVLREYFKSSKKIIRD